MNNKLYLLLIPGFLTFFYCAEGDVTKIEGTGTVEAVQVDISSAVAGKVKNISVEEGDRISSGDVILAIDDEDYRIQEKLARARLDAASAQLKMMLEGARKEDVQQAQEKVKAAKASFEKSRANFERINNLFNSGSATKSLYDEARTGYEMAQAHYNAAQKALEKLLKGARAEEIKIAQSNKIQAEANLEFAEKKLSDCVITSPVTGTVTNKLVETGERVIPNGLVATITKTDSMWLTIFIGERDIGRVKTGQRAEIKIDTFPDRIFNGTVRFIAEEAEFTPKNIQTKDEREKLVFGVKILIDNRDRILKAGIPADATIVIQ